MSQKRKSGLQTGLGKIVERQTAPVEDKSRLSRGLIDKFSETQTPATQGTQGTQGQPSPVAPARDFQKVANSISRVAVPAGIFKGKSKQIYDFLYSKTRGAITPARTAQLTRKEMMRGSHVGSDKTLRENLLRLRAAGLVTWDSEETTGAHDGNLYTVYLPEEITPATQGTQGTEGSPGLFLPTLPTVETTQGTQGLSVERAKGSGDPKTSSLRQDQINDDEAFAELVEAFKQSTRELTGKPPTKAESAKYRELAEVLITELKIAAGRTTVSSVPAFLAEHLRRRLFKKDKAQLEAEVKSEPAGKGEQGIDASKCPDCFGTGMYYPNGFEKGVAKCRHANLGEDHGKQ